MVWQNAKASLEKKHLQASVKCGGGSWGVFLQPGLGIIHFIDGNMDKTMYIDILKRNLKEIATCLGTADSFIFYQDNDLKHKTEVTRT
ncbi:hypothetical protein Trydic_g692 [Trypoxylus dichotomus]